MELDSDGEMMETNSGNEDIIPPRRSQSRFFSGGPLNKFHEIKNAFCGKLKTFYYRNGKSEIKDLCYFLNYVKTEVVQIIQNLLESYGALKFNVVSECTYIKPISNELQQRTFKTRNKAILASSSVDKILKQMFSKLCREESEYEGKGSGWTLSSVDGLLLRFSRYRPLRGSTFIPLPDEIARKRAVINPKNFNDNNCFEWALLSKYTKDCRITKKTLEHRYKFNFSGISFPTPIKEISKFEKNNSDASVNVYGLDSKKTVYPLRITNEEKPNHFDLLYITRNGVGHYCYISEFSRLIRSQLTTCTHKVSVCKRCFKHYQGPKRKLNLKTHVKDCSKLKPARILMPSEPNDDLSDSSNILQFKNHHHSLKLPIVCYADFECLLIKVNEKTSKKTVVNNIHEPMSFGIYLVYDESMPDSITSYLPNKPYIYRGKNAPAKFMHYIKTLANLIGDLTSLNVPMSPLTDEERQRFRNATNCELCESEFTLLNPPVRDHCHFTGKFRNVLCNSCNLKRQSQKFLPVFMHGSSNYDNHFIVRELGCDSYKIGVIPNTTEKFVTFSKHTQSGITLRFIDTYRFMDRPLSELANNLPKESFNHTKKFFSQSELPFVTRKGVFPYNYADSWDKLNEKHLPEKSYFYKGLGDPSMVSPENETFPYQYEPIDDSEYEHAVNVWSKFNCTDLGSYSDLYLKIDILLLCDTFENFRTLCIDNYGLDCAHYFSLPGFTFDAMLKYTKVELELLSNYDMYMFIERGIRGGTTTCSKRHACANNKYMKSDYNPNVESSFLMYYDSNNLYGLAMSQAMPINSFKWLSKQKVKKFDVSKVPNDSPVGYICEIDIEYPSNLHDHHNDLPLLPENKCPPNSKQKKLLTTLEDKKNYICHYVNLKQAIQLGMKLKRINRILKFNQSPWLKPYIDWNTDKRTHAQNPFEEDLFKKMNNAMFGKSIENIRKRLNLELVSSQKRMEKLVCKPNFLDRVIYSESLAAVSCSKESILFNKPIYIGFSVLELSKVHMYSFHYNVMKKYFGTKIRLLYSDTDSLFYEILTDDIYDQMNSPELKQYFDTSNYDKNHPCFSMKNKKVLGLFKDECSGKIIVEYIGLRPKLYCYKIFESLVKKKAKGIKNNVVQRGITFDDFKSCLLDRNSNICKQQTTFKSKKHVIRTVTVNKIALNARDDKRVTLNDGVNTLAYGHYKLKNC